MNGEEGPTGAGGGNADPGDRSGGDDELAERLRRALSPDSDREPEPGRVDDVRAAAERRRALAQPDRVTAIRTAARRRQDSDRDGADRTPARRTLDRRTRARRTLARREVLLGGVAAGVGVVGGAIAVRIIGGDGDDDGDAPRGEPVAASAVATGTRADVALIDHTWGLETVLTLEGVPAGRRYATTYQLRDGDEVGAGAFTGVADTTLVCNQLGPVRMAEVASIVVADDRGELVRVDLV